MFDESSQREAEAFQSFSRVYRMQHSEPVERSAMGLGWQFTLALVWAIASVLTVAIITSNEFYIIAAMSGVTQIIAVSRAIFSLIAVEGGIVIAASLKAAQTKSYAAGLLNAAIYLSVGISVVAGLGASVTAISGIDPAFIQIIHYVLVITVGVGGSLVAWVSGEVVGAEIAKVLGDKEVAVAEHKVAMQEYEDKLREAFTRSDLAVIARSATKAEANKARSLVQSSVQSVQSRNEQNEQQNEQFEQQPKTKMVFEYLGRKFYETEKVPGPREIERDTGVSVGTASKARALWMKQMNMED